ncbi:hypothetical protein MOQ_005034 [Trypanosoma cruzi marinkellei]|uniref:Uncharacterized protein n=1 Tax=Trypanosoma cruzi marinkellei TaxID=85056 RepID=K2MZG5_TRYCR|nr:hypothetical protein MOQ_005034 [Trypanosoma cruzi marinkellei]
MFTEAMLHMNFHSNPLIIGIAYPPTVTALRKNKKTTSKHHFPNTIITVSCRHVSFIVAVMMGGMQWIRKKPLQFLSLTKLLHEISFNFPNDFFKVRVTRVVFNLEGRFLFIFILAPAAHFGRKHGKVSRTFPPFHPGSQFLHARPLNVLFPSCRSYTHTHEKSQKEKKEGNTTAETSKTGRKNPKYKEQTHETKRARTKVSTALRGEKGRERFRRTRSDRKLKVK